MQGVSMRLGGAQVPLRARNQAATLGVRQSSFTAGPQTVRITSMEQARRVGRRKPPDLTLP
jgi:hypothetical protein